METSLRTGFAQIFSRCPQKMSCPKFGGGCSPPRPPGPYAYEYVLKEDQRLVDLGLLEQKDVVSVLPKGFAKSLI